MVADSIATQDSGKVPGQPQQLLPKLLLLHLWMQEKLSEWLETRSGSVRRVTLLNVVRLHKRVSGGKIATAFGLWSMCQSQGEGPLKRLNGRSKRKAYVTLEMPGMTTYICEVVRI